MVHTAELHKKASKDEISNAFMAWTKNCKTRLESEKKNELNTSVGLQ